MFWIFALLLILLALGIILPPLLKKTIIDSDDRRDQNIHIAKEQLADLETAFGNNEMQQDDYLARRDELEQSLYSDVTVNKSSTTRYTKPSIISTVLIALLIPAITLGMYTKYGDSTAADPATAQAAKKVPMTADGKPDIDAMVSGLRKRLEEKPNNPQGWYMLGRSYMAIKRYNDAAYAYEQLFKLQPDDPKTMLFLADATAMANQGNVAGRPAELIEKSLKLEPNNLTGLWLGGMSSSHQNKHVEAIERWTTLMPLLKEQPQQLLEVRQLIAAEKKKMSPDAIATLPQTTNDTPTQATQDVITPAQPTVAIDPKSIVVTVTLSEQFKSQVSATDTVFIYAKAMAGPPMPLAAKRIQVKDLPITLTLDDSLAMIPTMKLSAFPRVKLGARVSKTGNAISVNGDFYTEKKDILVGSKQILVIDSILQK
ncbi:MAG: c-type cytochrome biogenesis protein CcmI [Cocleimonas sp.]|nr:c-type cytochrome biogenesis protein CcmI [Cocleimonas sp.]